MNENERYLLFLRATYSLRLLSSPQFPERFLSDEIFTGALGRVLPGWAYQDLMYSQEDLGEELPPSRARGRRYGVSFNSPSRPLSSVGRKVKRMLTKGLQEFLDYLEPKPKQEPQFEQKLQRLGDVFEMDATERDILRLLGACGVDYELRELLDDGELSFLRKTFHRYVALLLCSPVEEVRKRLAYGSRMRRLGVLDDNEIVQSEQGMMELSRPVLKILASDASPDNILETIISREPLPELDREDYRHLARDLDIVRPLLESAWRQRRRGVNVLLYGPPGLGKTQFARLLANETGAAAYALSRTDDDGSLMNTQDRVVAYELFQRMCRGETRPLLVIDEAEGMLVESSGLMALLGGRTERDNALKGWLTDALERNDVPVIWLVNHHHAIHDAAKRRFSHSIGFEELDRQASLRIWQRALASLPNRFALSQETLQEMVGRYELSPGNVAQALSTWHAATGRRKPQPEVLESILGRAHELHHCAKPKTKRVWDMDEHYDPALLHLDSDVDAARLTMRVRRFFDLRESGAKGGPDQLTLLFHGAPGTGKTELAKYLARETKRKLQVEPMSDLLSKWLGESEQNIARAFKRAAEADNILLLDEFDSLAYSRERAERSWEVSQTNELLQQIENFPGVLIASTNLLDNLDQAIHRRFSHKIGFLGIRRERRATAVSQYFADILNGSALAAPFARRLERLPSLHPGDFRAVQQQVAARLLDGTTVTPEALVEALEDEASYRKGNAQKIGFGRQ